MLEFDAQKQRDFVLGAHKRKLKRRMEGAKLAKEALKRQLAQERHLRFEDARSIYNMNCQVPILADYRLASQPDLATLRQKRQTEERFKEEEAKSFAKDPSTTVLVTAEPLYATPIDSAVYGDAPAAKPAAGAGGRWAIPETLHASVESLQRKTALRNIMASKPKPKQGKPGVGGAKPGKPGKAAKAGKAGKGGRRSFDASRFMRQQKKGSKKKKGKPSKAKKGKGGKGKGKGRKK
eukprot:EG_transcript_20663